MFPKLLKRVSAILKLALLIMPGISLNSPEVWKDLPYDIKSDIWSLGCVLYETAALKPPFMADDMSGLYKKVLKGSYPKIPSQFSNDLSNMIRMLLQPPPLSRPTCGIQLIR